jgi:hypothetical protein
MNNEIYVWSIVILSWIIGLYLVYKLARENYNLRCKIIDIEMKKDGNKHNT